uniref:hypothetical protein n=1 Tax=Cupriavidus ulmosensis TaxID=3065913 RepID=UPI00296AAD18|nr:hypothetical protein [Cupriavidus sp. CV2]
MADRATLRASMAQAFHGGSAGGPSKQRFIVNYGDLYRHGEPIAYGIVESAVNQVVSKR